MDLSRVPQKLKVVHIASGDRWAGAEVQLYTLLTQLNKNDDIEPSAILLNDGELAQRLRAQHIHVDVIDESQHSTLTIFRKLITLLRAHSPDIVHTHRQKENILGSLANFFSSRAASVRTVHGAPEHSAQSTPQKVIDALDRWTGNHLQQRVIAVSGDLAIKLQTRFKTDHITVIENGVDTEAVLSSITSVDFREVTPDALHIGIVGRLDPVKRVDIFLDTAHNLLTMHPSRPWQFHIFGEGVLRPQLEAQARTLGITKKVKFHGHRTDIASCIAGIDILVMCSDHEGLPMTILESIAIGTPVVAHAVGELTKIFSTIDTACLVYEHDANHYALGVTDLLGRCGNKSINAKTNLLPRMYFSSENSDRISRTYQQLQKTYKKINLFTHEPSIKK